MNLILSAAKAQLVALESQRRKLNKIIEIAESLHDTEESGRPIRTAAATLAQRKSMGAQFATCAAVREILAQRRVPVKLSDLLKDVVKRGVEVGGKNPTSTLAARLSNSPEFMSIPGVGWWFTDRPFQRTLVDFEESEGVSMRVPPSDSNPN